jgi:flagellar biogenesis protein FliO
MNRKFFTLLLALGIIPFSTFAGVKVASLDLRTADEMGHLDISVEGRSKELPDVKVEGKTILINLGSSDAFNSINKNVRGAELSAESIKGMAIIKAILPYEVPKDSVNLGWKNKNITVNFKRGKITAASTPAVTAPKAATPKKISAPAPVAAPAVKVESKVSKDLLNEEYLNKLMEENSQDIAKREAKKDEVSLKQAAPVKAAAPEARSEGFSFAGYAAKFTIFLAMVLGLFYGVVQLLKKGVFNRGKLGFLNNTQMIEVLSTTYVSPKRTLMVVRAHKQIFLVANSESGFTYLSEMKDTSGLIKEGEKQITGTNFDLNLSDAEKTGLEALKLKDNIMESTPVPEEKGIASLSAKDIVKFSDELKKKAKKLKPIEFN